MLTWCMGGKYAHFYRSGDNIFFLWSCFSYESYHCYKVECVQPCLRPWTVFERHVHYLLWPYLCVTAAMYATGDDCVDML